jgi:hypothetical protein
MIIQIKIDNEYFSANFKCDKILLTRTEVLMIIKKHHITNFVINDHQYDYPKINRILSFKLISINFLDQLMLMHYNKLSKLKRIK